MWFYLLVITLTLTYILITRKLSHWKRYGVPGPKPLPLVGNLVDYFMGRLNLTEIFADIYDKYKQYPFVGFYRGSTPCLLLRDPGVIKNVMIKDFKHFLNIDIFVDKEIDPILGRNPFVLKDEEWKKSRQEIVPAFSISKIKAIFPLIDDVSKRLVKYLNNYAASPSEGGLSAKELATKFTCDNVAFSAFGLEGKCLEEPNAEFRQLAEKFISPDNFQGFKFAFFTFIAPTLAQQLSLKLLPQNVEDRVTEMVSQTVEYRKKNNIVRNDFLDFVSQLTSSKPIETAAHAANFIVDGVETSSNAMANILFELAMNPECQSKAREEISSVLESENGELSYETLQRMTYLDACINESLRLHPPLAASVRTCNQQYKMETVGPEYEPLSVTVEPGTPVVIPILGLHMDPRYFPEPEKYIPERFMSKDNLYKNCYFPFGDGPRSCIGQRFGFIQIKIGLARLLKNFEISINKKTQLPLKYLPFYFLLAPKGGIWLDVHEV